MFEVYIVVNLIVIMFFFFKQKTAYEMRISDWSSDVCSSDLSGRSPAETAAKNASTSASASFAAISSSPAGALPRVSRSAELDAQFHRSEERRVGKECVSTCRSRWSPYN